MTTKKSTPPAQTRDGIRWLAAKDLYYLAYDILGYTELAPSFHMPLIDAIQTTPYAKNLWMVARCFFKTTILTIAGNIQRILRNPDIRILIASNKAENAEAVLAEIKGLLTPGRSDAADRLQWLYPEIFFKNPEKDADIWTTSRIAVQATKRRREPTLTAIGLHGELTGRHYDHGSFDDLVGLENSQTREERQRTTQWWQAAQSLLDPGSTEDNTGTPWDFDDHYNWLLTQKAQHGMALGVYKRPCWEPCAPGTPGGAEVDGFGWVRPTFPERFPIAELLRIKREAGSTRFAAQYLLEPVDEETAVFPRAKAVVKPRRAFPSLETLWVVATLDPAISQKGWADYSAHAVVGFDHENTMWVLHLARGRWKESEVIAEVYAACTQYRPVAVGIEAIGFQKMFLHLFQRAAEQRQQYLPLVKLERDTKITKNTRIRVLEPLWNAGQLVLADDLPALDDFLDEAARFRLTKESTHDDMLDALADCLQLRVRPPAPGPTAPAVDSEVAERAAWEDRVQQDRVGRGAGRLDESSLKVQWSHAQDFAARERGPEFATVGDEEVWR